MTSPVGSGRLIVVVGPSGAGKDTLLACARTALAGNPGFVFPRRVVTRPASDAEDNDTLSDAAFDRAAADGAFAFWWHAHGLKYGIPRGIDDDLRAGRTVVCNTSRAMVPELRNRYAHLDAVLVTAPADVLATRLADRSRVTDGSLAGRMRRSETIAPLELDHLIENAGSIDAAAAILIDIIRG